jgi:hypothetical protein
LNFFISGCDVVNLSLGFVIDRLDVPAELSPQQYEDAISGLQSALNFALNYASDRKWQPICALSY